MRKQRLHSLDEEDMESFNIKDVFQLFIRGHLIYGDHDKIPVKPEYSVQSLETLGAGATLSLCLPSCN